MSRIANTFQNLAAASRKALIPFVSAGDPDLAATLPLMHAMVQAGADIIELGVPFSDPMADGPTIQRASERALRQGTTLSEVLSIVRNFRATDTKTPVVLMGYANPIERMGGEAFAQAARASGVDGVLVVDYPPEESRDFAQLLRRNDIDPIFLLSPTSREERVSMVAELASGYIYYVSLRGVTGAKTLDLADVAARIPRIRALSGLPVGVGFGIRDGATARAIAGIADAAVVGSRIIEEMEASPRAELVQRVARLVAELRGAIDQV